MQRPPPTSPLFPYTTLFRSDAAQSRRLMAALAGRADVASVEPDVRLRAWYKPNDPSYPAQWHYHDPKAGVDLPAALDYARSEEHTSELQSLAYIVCRLLLEK